jgi:uncharacterized protein (DUF169 family)
MAPVGDVSVSKVISTDEMKGGVMDFALQESLLSDQLGLRWRPVALTFQATAPAGIRRVDRPQPAGCGYWKLAAQGKVFCTEASDHYHCTIGAYTHGVDLPPEVAGELEATVGTMVGLRYIMSDEVADLPRVPGRFGVVVYAPLADSPCDPDVVLIRGDAKQMMLLVEACLAAGLEKKEGLRPRPTCTIIPEAMTSKGTLSFSCIGNRVYTGLGDHELYLALPGPRLADVVDQLGTILRANHELEGWHRERAAALAGG